MIYTVCLHYLSKVWGQWLFFKEINTLRKDALNLSKVMVKTITFQNFIFQINLFFKPIYQIILKKYLYIYIYI